MINYILWETCPNAGKEATGLEPHPCIVSLVRIAVFCAHWTEPPRRGAELSLGPCACCLRWRNHPSSPWEVGGKKPPGDGSTTLALLHFMWPIHFLLGCVSSATCSASARVRLPCSCVTALYSTSPQNRNRRNRNHLDICLSFSQKNRN